MISLVKSEWYQAGKSLAVRIAFAVILVSSVLSELSLKSFSEQNSTLDLLTIGGSLCSTMSDSAMCLLLASIFSGLMIGAAFENRTIQLEISNGKRRFHVFLAKMIVYTVVVAGLYLAYWFSTAGMDVIYLRYGLGTADVVGNLSRPEYLAGMVAAGMAAYMSLTVICGIIGFCLQKASLSMGICFALILAGGNLLAAVLPGNIMKLLEYTPLRLYQRVLKYDLTWGDIGSTCVLSAVWIILILGLGIWKFQKMELK